MEGACGKILDTDDPRVVLKKLHRRNRAQQRTCSLNAEQQVKMQTWAHTVCVNAGLTRLFVPKAWSVDTHSYKMERIDVSKPLPVADVATHPVLKDLRAFFYVARDQGVFPADFELYVQPDGTVAMVDFDKFASWSSNGSIVFPWGLTTTDAAIRKEYPFLFEEGQ
jgi:hypothetical protein